MKPETEAFFLKSAKIEPLKKLHFPLNFWKKYKF